jgi:hypothetical protein
MVVSLALSVPISVLGNVVAERMPDSWRDRALPLFLAGSGVLFVVGLGLYLLDRRPATADGTAALSTWDRQRMLALVGNQARDILWLPEGDPPSLALTFEALPSHVTAPRQRFTEQLAARGPSPDIGAVFEVAEGALLLLGAPGAGKSRLLAELAADRVARAEQDASVPMPVLVSLASWAPGRGPLSTWLAQELHARYDVPLVRAREWLAAGLVAPLLDGADESADLTACIGAVDDFRQAHGLVPIAVTCRIAEYEAAGARLRLRGAVRVEPLTAGEIRRYLTEAALPADTVDELVAETGDLLTSPLGASLVVRTYRAAPTMDLSGDTSTDARARLIEMYVEAMLSRRRRTVGDEAQAYPQEQTRAWLGWLARMMHDGDLAQFRLDRIQPRWLPASAQRGWNVSVWAVAVVLAGLGLLAGSAVLRALGATSLGWAGLVLAVSYLLFLGVVFVPNHDSRVRIEPVEVVRWRAGRRQLAYAVIAAVGIAATWATALLPNLTTSVWRATLLVEATLWPVVVLATGFRAELAAASRTPTDGIRRSLRHAAVAGAAGIVLGAVFGLAWSRWVEPTSATWFAVTIGIVAAVVAAYFAGGRAAVLHYAARVALARSGCAPLRYVRFLDYAAERVLLRRVGGAYEFIHPLVREHFAASRVP